MGTSRSPTTDDRVRAADLVTKLVPGPLGYVDAILVALAERLQIRDIATVDFKPLGLAGPVCGAVGAAFDSDELRFDAAAGTSVLRSTT